MRAVKKISTADINEIARRQIADLQRTIDNGFDPGYRNVQDYLGDFWCNFPWDQSGVDVFAAILNNPAHMRVVAAFDKKFGLDKPLPMGAPNEDSVLYGLENPED